jgi:DNA anti-recombination protein RmuC
MTKEYTDLILETMNDKFQQMLECFSVHSKEIADLRTELKEDIALVDAKVMGLAKRVDHVETSLTERIDQVESSLSERIDQVEGRLSGEIAEVRADLTDHRNNTEMHSAPKRRTLKKAA